MFASSTVPSTVRSLALVASGAALTAGVGLGLAHAEPGRPDVPRGYHFGSDRLLQSQDFHDVGLLLDTETVNLNTGNALDACLGEETTYDIAGTELPAVGAAYASDRVRDQHVTETAALAESPAKATAYTAKIVRQMKACQHPPKGHFSYGPKRTMRVGSGSATYFVAFDGQGHQDGGAAVLRDGAAFAVIDLAGPTAPSRTVMKKLITAGLARLA